MSISITYLILLIIVGILLPINGVLSGKRIKQFLSQYPEGRLFFYKQTVVIQIILAFLVLGAMLFNNDSIDEIGLSFLKQAPMVISLQGICFLGWWLIRKYRFDEEKLRQEVAKGEAVKFLLPSTDEEYRWSIAVSFAAGICEEIVFRGFLYWQLSQLLTVIPAILLTNLIFGLCHYGTGIKNASLATGLGVLLSVIFLYTESLWLLMIIHVLTDILSMTKGKRYFEQNPEDVEQTDQGFSEPSTDQGEM